MPFNRSMALVGALLWLMANEGWCGADAMEAELADQGIRAFQAQDFKWARESFTSLKKRNPNHPAAEYYLGILELREGKVESAIKYWQHYVEIDPAGAESNGVPRRLTLLQDETRKTEIEKIMKSESQLSKLPVEPKSIAVMGFVNKGDEKYQILAKGITALIVTDLSQVPGLVVLEREKVQKLLEEMKLSKSGLVEEENKIATGRLLRAEKVMLGDFTIQENAP
ncbi:MAG: hypothetical protein HQL55_17005 [Magnetococcales bacterium]|nr:hypothetical protein [Magnetococcales bacterium]